MNNLLKRLNDSNKFKLNKNEQKELVDIFIAILKEELVENGEISLKNFGKLYVVRNESSNLSKEKDRQVCINVRFKPSVNLKKEINKKKDK